MYICVCRGISDRDVKDAVQGGAHSAKCIFRSCGKKPKCGKCMSYLSEQIVEHVACAKSEGAGVVAAE